MGDGEAGESPGPGPRRGRRGRSGLPPKSLGIAGIPAALALAAVCAAAWAALSLGGGTRAASVYLDEAFVAAWPGLAGELEAEARPGRYATISLDEGPGRLLDLAKAAGYGREGGAGALVTSPLLAMALASGETELRGLPGGSAQDGEKRGIGGLGGAFLVVPAYQGPQKDYLFSVQSDSREAYAAAGRACGAYIAGLGPGETGRTGAILYRAGRTEDEEGARAFVEAYGASAGMAPQVERLEPGANGEIDEEGGIRRLLALDLGLLLVGPGLRLNLVLPRLARPDLALGLVLGDMVPDFPPGQAPDFWICSDAPGLATRVMATARRARSLAPGPIRLPALLVYEASVPKALGLRLAAEGAKKSKIGEKPGSRR